MSKRLPKWVTTIPLEWEEQSLTRKELMLFQKALRIAWKALNGMDCWCCEDDKLCRRCEAMQKIKRLGGRK